VAAVCRRSTARRLEGRLLKAAAIDAMPLPTAERYESQAGGYWEFFYKRNGTAFFRDR
jgi:hypothetical protein